MWAVTFISSWGARTLRQANSGLVTANVYVCTYVGGGSVVGGRASSAAANSWESQQSTPVSLGRDQRDHLVTPLLLYRFLLFFVVYLWLLRNQSALLRVLSSQSSWYLDAVQEGCAKVYFVCKLPLFTTTGDGSDFLIIVLFNTWHISALPTEAFVMWCLIFLKLVDTSVQKNGVMVTYIHSSLLLLLTSFILIIRQFNSLTIHLNTYYVTWRSFVALYRNLIIYVHTFSDIIRNKRYYIQGYQSLPRISKQSPSFLYEQNWGDIACPDYCGEGFAMYRYNRLFEYICFCNSFAYCLPLNVIVLKVISLLSYVDLQNWTDCMTKDLSIDLNL